MKVFVLTVKPEMLTATGADACGFGEWSDARGHLVIASDEQSARECAATWDDPAPWWRDEDLTDCLEVIPTEFSGPIVLLSNEPTG